jgi:dTDP-4-amino-4,6-dideoxygalactose transaminase
MSTEAPTWAVTLSDIDFGAEEETAVLEVLRSKWLSAGSKTAEFEMHFAEAMRCSRAVAVSNCTAALHLALLAVGVKPGDEVIVPSLTFVATANAVLYCGAVPVFADIHGPDRLFMDPEDVARKVGPRTRVIVPMHYGGYPCDMDALQAIADRHEVRVVADAAHAPGATIRGRAVAEFGDVSCFSFFANKNLVTGEGGMIATNDVAIADFARLHRSHGMTAVSYDKQRGHASSYDVVSTGFNYRMTELQSALGLVQLGKLARSNEARRTLVRSYRARFGTGSGITVPFAGLESESACHIFPIVLPEGTDRAAVQAGMKSRGIQTSVHYHPVHRFTTFTRYSAVVPETDRVAERLLTLPLHPLMTRQDVETVCEALMESL